MGGEAPEGEGGGERAKEARFRSVPPRDRVSLNPFFFEGGRYPPPPPPPPPVPPTPPPHPTASSSLIMDLKVEISDDSPKSTIFERRA